MNLGSLGAVLSTLPQQRSRKALEPQFVASAQAFTNYGNLVKLLNFSLPHFPINIKWG